MIKTSKDFDNLVNKIHNTIEYKTEEITLNIAFQVYDRLKSLNMNQNDFAKKLGVSRSYVSQILNGKSNMTIESIIKIADAIELQAEIRLIKPIWEIEWLEAIKKTCSSASVANPNSDSSFFTADFLYSEESLDGNNFEAKPDHITI